METQYIQETAPQEAILVRSFLNKVYGWMAASMAVTALVAWYAVVSVPLYLWVTAHPILLLVGGLALVLVMSFGRNAISASGLGVLLIAFSAVEGLVLGPFLTMFTSESLALTFACTAGMFGGMTLYGMVTKRNLSVLGRTLFMLLIGLIIAGVVNMFWGNGLFDLICSGIGVVVFSLFTAYDTQNIIRLGQSGDETVRSKGAVLGALELYLDFLNLMLYLLRFLGRVKE